MAELTIVHTSDLHGRLTFRSADFLRQLKDRHNALLLDSGDCTALPNILAVPWTPPVARLMARAGYHAVAVGNREWFFRAFGIRWMARALPCPLLATNIAFSAASPPIQPMAVLEAGGHKVAVLALARKMVDPASWLQRLCDHRWVEPAAALAEYLPRAQAEADFVVVLSHLGLDGDLEIAKIGGIDLILGGHDHILTPRGLKSLPAPIVHSGYHGRWATIVQMRKIQGRVQADVKAVRLEPVLPEEPIAAPALNC